MVALSSQVRSAVRLEDNKIMQFIRNRLFLSKSPEHPFRSQETESGHNLISGCGLRRIICKITQLGDVKAIASTVVCLAETGGVSHIPLCFGNGAAEDSRLWLLFLVQPSMCVRPEPSGGKAFEGAPTATDLEDFSGPNGV